MQHRRATLTAAVTWKSPAGLLLCGLSLLVFGCSRSTPAPAPTRPAVASRDLLATFESPFENVRPGVAYLGSEACRKCHEGHADSYHATGMGRSMSPVDPDSAPPDGMFDHAASRRRYQVLRRDGKLWHRELKLTDSPEEIVLAEFPVTWAVGSGRHALTYVAEVDGFLVESPITWYASTKSWGMSPGYDLPEHFGFQREIGEGCLDCHAGRAVAVDRSLHRMQILEDTIGCERCHGPGELHAARHRQSEAAKIAELTATMDPTIVNPAHLSRDLAEAICQQCHLRSQASVIARGKKLSDFRPGLPLQAFREDYVLQTPDLSLTVVGHVEQLHLSRCYQESPELSCHTCHDPHVEPDSSTATQIQNQHCAKCHDAGDCHVDLREREVASPSNDCVQCHMPKAPTEVPHLAFTHHRIGIHRAGDRRPTDPRQVPQGLAELRPFHATTGISEADQQRSLGLAYVEAGSRQEAPDVANAFRERAWRILRTVRANGPADSAVETALARLAFELQSAPVEPFARAALSDPELSGKDRCNVLFLLAEAAMQRRDDRAALPFAEELTQLRRHPRDWLMLADCRNHTGRDGIPALEMAVAINPGLVNVRRFLIQHYTATGKPVEAARHQQRLDP